MEVFGTENEPKRNQWTGENQPIQYADGDIWVWSGKRYDKGEVPLFGNVSPRDDERFQDDWPLPIHDVGAEEKDWQPEELVMIAHTNPKPWVAFVTPIHAEAVNDYYGWGFDNPMRGAMTPAPVEGKYDLPQINFNRHSLELLNRLAKLYNNERVNRVHLIQNRVPDAQQLYGDLKAERYIQLFNDQRCWIHPKVVYAFQDKDFIDIDNWYPCLWPDYLDRRRIEYMPTERGINVMQSLDTVPPLRGDQREGLPHRYTAGAITANHESQGQTVLLYRKKTISATPRFVDDAEPIEDKEIKPDTIIERDHQPDLVKPVETDHNNRKRWLETLEHMYYLHRQKGMEPHLVSPKRKTALKILRYGQPHLENEFNFYDWARSLEGDISLNRANEVLRDRYEADSPWFVAGISTIDREMRMAFSSGLPNWTKKW